MKSYNGKKPYIFFSYCHADKDKVIAIAEKLFNMNFRIWYDKYLGVGEPFDDDIAEHIKNCEVFLIFLSEDYLKSNYCDTELKYAQSKGRKCLAVYLSEVNMDKYAGMEMCLRTNNNINGWLYNAEECADMIAGSKAVDGCKRADCEPYEQIVMKDKLKKSKTASIVIPILSFFTMLILFMQKRFDSTFSAVLHIIIFIISCILFNNQEKRYKYQTDKTSKYSVWLLIMVFLNLDNVSIYACVADKEYKQVIIMLAVSVFHFFVYAMFTADIKTISSDWATLLIYIVRFVVLLSLIGYSERIRWAVIVGLLYIAFGFMTSAIEKNKTICIIGWMLMIVCLLLTVGLLYKKFFDWLCLTADKTYYNIIRPVYNYIERVVTYIYYIIFIE